MGLLEKLEQDKQIHFSNDFAKVRPHRTNGATLAKNTQEIECFLLQSHLVTSSLRASTLRSNIKK